MNTIVQKVCLCVVKQPCVQKRLLAGNDVSAELERVETAKHFCVSQVPMTDTIKMWRLELQLLPGKQIPLNSRFAKFVKLQPSKQKLMKIGLQASLRANS